MNKCTNCDSNETCICPCESENKYFDERFSDWAYSCKSLFDNEEYSYMCKHRKTIPEEGDRYTQCFSWNCPRISSFISYLKRKFCNV